MRRRRQLIRTTGLLVHKKLCSWFRPGAVLPTRLLFSRKLCLSQWRGSKWRVEGHENYGVSLFCLLLVPHDCKKNHHRPKFCHCVFYSVLRRELSAYSMFWWGMAVKKLLSFSSLKFSYSYGCLLACLRAIHKWRYTKLFPIFLTTLPSLFHLYYRAVGTGLPRVAAATTIF